MNKTALVKFSENLLEMIKSEESLEDSSIKSINACILGMSVIQAAVEEITRSMVKMLESINAMARDGLIIRGVDYNTIIDHDGDYVLRLNYCKFYDDFIDYCQEIEVEHPILDLKEFKILLRVQDYCKAYNRPVQFDNTAGSYTDKKLCRGAVLKIYDLKNLGADIDFLLEE